MSFSLLCVPKRAALIALRGLFVGTSGALLLVLEDRRRRIDQARRVIHNGKELRATKQYRGARKKEEQEAAAAAAAEAAAGPTRFDASDNDFHNDSTTRALSTTLAADNVAVGEVKNPSTIRLPTLPTTKATTPPPSSPWGVAHSTVVDKIRRIKEAADLGDPQSLRVGIIALKHIAREPRIVTEDEQPKLMQAVLTLYRKCHDADSVEQAARILHYAAKIGPVPWADYYALNPQNHVERGLAELATIIQQLRSPELQTKESATKAAWLDARLAAQGKLDRVLTLLLPDFQNGATVPAVRKWQWCSLAERAIRLALDLGDSRIDNGLFAQNLRHADVEKAKLATDKIKEGATTRNEPLRRVVTTFVQLEGKLTRPDSAVWKTIGNIVSDVAHATSSDLDPATVLIYLVTSCPAGLLLRTAWVAKLLFVDWKGSNNKTKDLAKSQALFAHFETLGGCDKVTHLDSIYRTMMGIALEVEEWQVADNFLDKLKTLDPDAARHPQTLGLLAKAKAKMGNWSSAWEDLLNMEPKGDQHMGDAFVPILKEFSQKHTVRELDEFVRLSLQQLPVRITPYMVTLVANRYGALRDVVSFVTWLEYCAGQGVQVDAAFSNALLYNCRRNWDFNYQALKRVYQTLQTLNPGYVDKVTQNIMVSAALRANRRAAPTELRKEIVTLGVRFRKQANLRDPHDMRLWMRRAFALQHYRLVQTIYETAVKQGAPLDDGHLLLNIRAILQHNANVPKAVRILKEAKDQEILVDRATAHVFTFQIRRLFEGEVTDKEQVLRSVQAAMAQLQATGLDVSSALLLRVAYWCLQIHHVEGALNFARSALHLKKATYPDDVPTFQVFLSAYTARTDTHGLTWIIRGAYKAGLFHKRQVMHALRMSRQLFLKQRANPATAEALRIVEEALGIVQADRLELSKEREEVETATLSIMANAAMKVMPSSTNRDEATRRIEQDMERLIAANESLSAVA